MLMGARDKMAQETNPRDVLFRVGNREIMRNGLYVITGPGAPNREMAVAYDAKTNKSTWVTPVHNTFYRDGEGLMATVLSVDLLRDAFTTPKPYVHFLGGNIDFDHNYKPTAEQWEILTHWYERLNEAGIGGAAPDLGLEDIREEFREHFLSKRG